MLNQGQQLAMKALKSGKNVFLSGEAGTGKSYVLNQFLVENSHKNILVCAPTGIAAINVNGSTLHRVFKVPVEPIAPTKTPKSSEPVQKADIIVIDEISMCRFDCFEYVAKSILKAEEEAQEKEKKRAKAAGEKPKKLKKKQLIVVGDFYQLPPVITEKDRPVLEKYWGQQMMIGDGFAFQAPMWSSFDFVTIELQEVVRQKGDIDFVTNLNKIRRGDPTALEWFNSKSARRTQKGISLCPTNKAAEAINAKESNKLKVKSRSYESTVVGTVNASDKATSDLLILKEGMQVMTLINDPENKFQNGTLGTIENLLTNTIEINIDGRIVEVVPYTWEVYDYKIEEDRIEKVTIGTFRQLPIKIAYAITIHKSQGQTYEALNVSPACFASGQLYVALSRAKSIKKLHLNTEIKPENLITSQAVINFYKHGITSYNPTESQNVTKSKSDESVTNSNTSPSRGGSRNGAGRKRKYGGETCTIRIPKSAKEAVQAFLASQEWE